MKTNRILALFLLTSIFVFVSQPAFADRDTVQFGTNIHVGKDASAHDVVCFFCSVEAQGEVKGDVVVFFGDIHIASKADHDVVSFFGKVKADDNVVVWGDMVSLFSVVRLGENVSVGKDMVSLFGSMHAPDSVTVAGDRVTQPLWLFLGPVILFGVIVIVVVREIQGRRGRRFVGYPFPPPPQQ